MKVIKARQWVPGYGWHYWGTGPWNDESAWCGPTSQTKGMPESFIHIGLSDLSGELIYEGDIVGAVDQRGHGCRGVVCQGDGEWLIETDDPTWPIASMAVLHGFRIIGNNIENPELMREDKEA